MKIIASWDMTLCSSIPVELAASVLRIDEFLEDRGKKHPLNDGIYIKLQSGKCGKVLPSHFLINYCLRKCVLDFTFSN
jgi:hypothetical protein